MNQDTNRYNRSKARRAALNKLYNNIADANINASILIVWTDAGSVEREIAEKIKAKLKALQSELPLL